MIQSYEGLEGATILLSGGRVSVLSSDDGVNSTAASGNGVTISGGTHYIYAGGDGIDANSRTSYSGIVFQGGNTVIISTSGGNSAIDTEQGYQYTGGSVVALMPSGGMANEATHCSNFSRIGIYKNVSLTIYDDNQSVLTLRMPCRLSGRVIYLGSTTVSMETVTSSSAAVDINGVCWH